MSENLKVTGVILILSLIVSAGLNLTVRYYEKPYKVQIKFCDGRPPVTANVKALKEPSRYSISNMNKGVPSYEGHLNVCDVKVVK